MKNHLHMPYTVFLNGSERANALIGIFSYLKSSSPSAANFDDILRSSLVLAVSSFDLLLHDLFREEALYRLSSGRNVDGLRVPFSVLYLDIQDKLKIIESSIRHENSYKSFVAPDKVAECLRCLVETPWDKISIKMKSTPDSCKTSLKNVVSLRNRIAHEADVNPNLAGIELWPIYKEDVEYSVNFLRTLGSSIIEVVDQN